MLFGNDKIKKIHQSLIKQAASYLDWLEVVYLYNEKQIKNILDLKIHKKEEVIESINDENKEEENIYDKIKKVEVSKEIKESLEWEYPYILSSKIPSKTSVTKIKEMWQENETQIMQKNEIHQWEKPKFINEDIKITNAEKGTLIHLCIKNLNEKEEYTFDKVKKLVQNLEEKQIITAKEAKVISIDKIYAFTKSKIWQQMKNAKKIMKEEPFYYLIPAEDIYKEKIDEKILVQGIIDLYYIDKEGKITLVDYKTDYVENSNEQKLIDKYKKQLEIYKKAIENFEKQKVENIYIYSTYLEKEIKVNL